MADADTLTDDETTAEDGEDGAKKKRTPGKSLVLRVVLPLVVLLAAGGGVYVSGLLDSLMGKDEMAAGDGSAAEPEPQEPQNLIYYELPEMLVNISGDGRRTHFLKIKVSLELADSDDVQRVEAILPRIIDNFQVYLRGLRIEDLQGSAGLYRLREELLTRVTLAAAPAKISDVLFREMIVQ